MARNTDGPLANEFARVLQEMQIGLGRSNALRAMGERSNLPDLRSFCSAMVQADAFGIPVGQVLRVQSSEMRVKRRQKAEEAAQKIPVKIMIPLVLFILPSLFVAVIGPAVIGMMDVVRWRRSPELSQREQVAITSRVFCLAAILGLSLVAGDATHDPDRDRRLRHRGDVGLRVLRHRAHDPAHPDRRDAPGRAGHGPDLPDVDRADALPRRAAAAGRAVPRASRVS